jgi:hypothetical protein
MGRGNVGLRLSGNRFGKVRLDFKLCDEGGDEARPLSSTCAAGKCVFI